MTTVRAGFLLQVFRKHSTRTISTNECRPLHWKLAEVQNHTGERPGSCGGMRGGQGTKTMGDCLCWEGSNGRYFGLSCAVQAKPRP